MLVDFHNDGVRFHKIFTQLLLRKAFFERFFVQACRTDVEEKFPF